MKNNNVDIERIQELILSFAEGDFSKRAEISSSRDDTDTVIAGINMLGEELESITVSRDYFLSIYNAISELLIIVDGTGKIADVNNSVCQKLHVARKDIIGENINYLLGEEKEFDEFSERYSKGQFIDSIETNIGVGDFQLPVRCSVSKIENDSHKGCVIIASDISFEKKVEKELLNTIITTEEKEKTRIAYDLHDSLGQELNAIRMYFDIAMRFKDNGEKFNTIINTCKKLVDGSIDSVRKIAKDLMPKALEDGELFSALNELSFSISNIIEVNKRLPDVEFRLATDKKVKIYRVIQEFFSNTMKHAGATQLELSAGKSKDCYFFQISDNGKGFEKKTSKLGNGVKNIETRLKALEAQYVYTSKKEIGTTLKFELNR